MIILLKILRSDYQIFNMQKYALEKIKRKKKGLSLRILFQIFMFETLMTLIQIYKKSNKLPIASLKGYLGFFLKLLIISINKNFERQNLYLVSLLLCAPLILDPACFLFLLFYIFI